MVATKTSYLGKFTYKYTAVYFYFPVYKPVSGTQILHFMKKRMLKSQDIHPFIGRLLYCYLEHNKHIWKVNTQTWTLKYTEQQQV